MAGIAALFCEQMISEYLQAAMNRALRNDRGWGAFRRRDSRAPRGCRVV